MDEVFAAVIQLYKRLKTDELTRVTLKSLLLQKKLLAPLCYYISTTGYSLSDQHILSPINPKYDLSDLQRFKKIYTNCFEIQNMQNLCFEF